MTPKEVALACDVNYYTVLRWIRKHGLPARRRGLQKSYTLEPAAVAKWCDENDVEIHNPFLAQTAS